MSDNFNQRGIVHLPNEISRTIIGSGGDGGYHSGNQPKILQMKVNEMEKKKKRLFAIRKLIPSECFVLMGMNKEDVDKCRAVGVSDSQLYKQAGNGLITNHVQFIMEHLYKCLYDSDYMTTDEEMEMLGYGVEE